MVKTVALISYCFLKYILYLMQPKVTDAGESDILNQSHTTYCFNTKQTKA